MRGIRQKAPFTLLALSLFLFGRRKPPQEENPRANVEPFPVPDIMKRTVTENDVAKARDRLRVVSLERDIISDALTKIYEAETKGQITETERGQLVQKYKVDLKRVDAEVDNDKKVVDLHELESAKEDLLKSFHEKLLEIDARIGQIRPAFASTPVTETKTPIRTLLPDKEDPPPPAASQTPNKEKPPREKPKNKAEERLEAIREEVLKAMDRLEQIESEG